MKNFLLVAGGFIGGFLTFAACFMNDVDDCGEVVYKDDKITVKAGANKKYGWRFAKVQDNE